MYNVAVFASGNGTNFVNLVNYFKNHHEIKIALLISDQLNCRALEEADKLCIPHFCFPFLNNNLNKSKKIKQEELIQKVLKRYNVAAIALAGYMRILSKEFIKVNSPIINIHPSLLPNYRGLNAYEKAYRDNVKYTGVTVHYVDEGVDTGEVILQERFSTDGIDSLSKLISVGKELEHQLYPKALEITIENIKKDKIDGMFKARSFIQRSVYF